MIEARSPSPKHRVRVLRPGPNATRRHAGTITRSHTVPQRVLLAEHEHMLRLDISDATLAICEKVDALSIRGGDVCLVNYGAQMSSRKKGKFGKAYVLRRSPMTSTCRKSIGEGVRTAGGFHTYPKTIRQLPVLEVSQLPARLRENVGEIESLAERMAALDAQRFKARVPDEKTRIGRQFDAADRRIDELVYELYGLTADEIALVEAAAR